MARQAGNIVRHVTQPGKIRMAVMIVQAGSLSLIAKQRHVLIALCFAKHNSDFHPAEPLDLIGMWL